MPSSPLHISICVCTFRRPHLLGRLLDKIKEQRTDGLFSYSVVVVDNDDQASGREVVTRAQGTSEIRIDYHVEPERSISLARNRAVKNATGELIAFIDDDEFPDKAWLINHFKTLQASRAHGVLGPVLPHFEAEAPGWLVKSGLVERTRFETGFVLKDPRHTRTGNVLIWKTVFDEKEGQFDPKYGRSGGGDAVFFGRMIAKGKTFIWCDEACVYETVPPERQTRAYYLKRAFTRGMTEAWETPFFSRGTARSVVAVVLYTGILPFLFLFGQPLFMKYLVKNCDHLAKMLAYVGIRLVPERPY